MTRRPRRGAKIKRDVEERPIDKREAIRHLIHAAIRMTAAREDPFAIHIIIQAAEDQLSAWAEREGVTLRASLLESVKPEFKEDVRQLLKETYNYLKHGMRDHDQNVFVGKIVERNVFELFFNVLNFGHLFGHFSEHMHAYITFIFILMPEVLSAETSKAVATHVVAAQFSDMTPYQYWSCFFDNLQKLQPGIVGERNLDLTDTDIFYDTPFRELREMRAHKNAGLSDQD